LSPHVMQTRNYASNHSSRAAVPTTQLCDAVCECLLKHRCSDPFWETHLKHLLNSYLLREKAQITS